MIEYFLCSGCSVIILVVDCIWNQYLMFSGLGSIHIGLL